MIELRPLSEDLRTALFDFFDRIPESDVNSFAEDVRDPAVVESWFRHPSRRTVAVEGDTVVGYSALLPQVGWSSHVGSLRLVVDPARRGAGVGRTLARAALLAALDAGLTKIVVEVVADSVAAIGMFQAIGFEPEALLRDHVRDRTGQVRDLVVLAHSVDDAWSAMATAGMDEAVS